MTATDDTRRDPNRQTHNDAEPEFDTYAAHALAYAHAGLAVLPLLPGAKKPATSHGKDDATTDAGQIERWWTERPRCNIGIRPPHGLVVIDVDHQHDGDHQLAELTARHGPLPATWTARTGQGGQHIWLRATGPFRGKLAPGIDLKSHSGYLVAPPSIHPNGNRYRWENNAPIAYAPRWLRPLIAPPSTPPPRSPGASINPNRLVRTVAQAVDGNRNRTLFWAACRAAAEGSLGTIRAELVDAAIGIGLPPSAVQATLRSAERTAAHV